jgi:hypothetical protein
MQVRTLMAHRLADDAHRFRFVAAIRVVHLGSRSRD